VRAQEPPASWPAFVRAFETYAEAGQIVGASALVMRDGRVLARHHVGYADLNAGRPVDERTIFHYGSITKTLNAIAVLQLRDRGLLDLDDPVTRWVPELRAVHDPYGSMDDITLRMLMAHSAGFRSATWPWGGDQPWQPFEPTEWSQLAAMLPYTEILFPPGSKHSYSNPGIIFLGRTIELLTGDDFEVYVDKNILKPLEDDPQLLRRHAVLPAALALQ
jgi:CubicO group peptidase (beta-lactamase class C family)